MATMVLSVYGDDRAGLVDSIAEVVADNGASWDKSYMGELAGKFAGIVSLSVPDAKVVAVTAGLEALGATGLEIAVHTFDEAPSAVPHRELTLELFGHDHPGIVHDLSHALAQRGVSIAELSTEIRPAPMGGGVIFEAHVTLHAPADISIPELRLAVDELAETLLVDIDLSASD